MIFGAAAAKPIAVDIAFLALIARRPFVDAKPIPPPTIANAWQMSSVRATLGGVARRIAAAIVF
jgi:hypothetical protein